MNWYVKNIERLPKRGAFFYGFFSLFGKAPVCGTGEQGSIPGDPQKCEWVNGEFCFASEFLKIDKESELTIDNSQKIIS